MKKYLFLPLIWTVACTGSIPADETPAPDTRTECLCGDLEVDKHYNRAHIYDTEAYFTGICRDFFQNTKQVKNERQYQEGKITGYVRTWHQNGQIASEKWFRNNLQHGVSKQWDTTGSLIYKAEYWNGKIKKRLSLEGNVPTE